MQLQMVVFRLYVWRDFYNTIFKVKHKVSIALGLTPFFPPPQPLNEKF